MKRVLSTGVAGVVLGGLIVVVQASPASAALNTVRSGSTITVTATGVEDIYFACQASKVTVNNVPVTPSMNCSDLTHVTVIGDASRQVVRGSMLDEPTSYPLHPTLTANLGDGNDTVYDTLGVDNLSLGPGGDAVVMNANGVPNLNTDLGADFDYLYVDGPNTSSTLAASSSGSTASVLATTSTGTRTLSATHAEAVIVRGGDGNDTLSTAGVTVASTVDLAQMYGNGGNDTMTGGPVGASFSGGTGTNTMTGGAAGDNFISESETDVITTGGGPNSITDDTSLRAGGRSIDAAAGSTNYYSVIQRNRDTTVRWRGAAGGASVMTSSLNRSGQQQLPQPVDAVAIDFYTYDSLDGRHLADVVALAGKSSVYVGGDPFHDDLADITVPTGTWSTNGVLGSDTYNIITDDPTIPNVSAPYMGAVSIHAPWTNLNQGFAHRVIRDLLFRFPGASERDQIRDDLAAATKTRPQVVAGLMNTDEYRGLDVDRVFVQFLRRGSDPGGRTYWINSLRNGKPLIKFRAQLFGSNEYFTKAGGTNADYMVKAYNDVLGRQPDPSGQTYWTNKLNNGADRGAVALQFLASTEARRNVVKDQFLRFLDRYPTNAESTTWVNNLAGATGEQDLIAFLAGSNAYFNRD